MIPHAQFPYDEGNWIPHFHDADEANQRSQIHMAAMADNDGNDTLARHIMGAKLGTNPLEGYAGPFGEGEKGQQFTPDMPNHMMSQYFGGYHAPGADPSVPGPFADPRKQGPSGGAGPAVTGPDYLERLIQSGGGVNGVAPYGSSTGQ